MVYFCYPQHAIDRVASNNGEFYAACLHNTRPELKNSTSIQVDELRSIGIFYDRHKFSVTVTHQDSGFVRIIKECLRKYI